MSKEIPLSIRAQVLEEYFSDIYVTLLNYGVDTNDEVNEYPTDWHEVVKALDDIRKYNLAKQLTQSN